MKTSNGSAAYFDVIGPHVADTTAKKKNDDDFDFDLDELFADL